MSAQTSPHKSTFGDSLRDRDAAAIDNMMETTDGAEAATAGFNEEELLLRAEELAAERQELSEGRKEMWAFLFFAVLMIIGAFCCIVAAHYMDDSEASTRAIVEGIGILFCCLTGIIIVLWLRHVFDVFDRLVQVHAAHTFDVHKMNKVLKSQQETTTRAGMLNGTGDLPAMEDSGPLPEYDQSKYQELYQSYVDLKQKHEYLLPLAREHRDKCQGRKEKFHILKEKYEQNKQSLRDAEARLGASGRVETQALDEDGMSNSAAYGTAAIPDARMFGQYSVPEAINELTHLKPAVGIVFVSGPKNGVFVKHVPPELPAYQCGLRVGDIVEEVNGVATYTKVNFKEALRNVKVGDEMKLRVDRNGVIQNLTLAVGAHGYSNDEVNILRRRAAGQ